MHPTHEDLRQRFRTLEFYCALQGVAMEDLVGDYVGSVKGTVKVEEYKNNEAIVTTPNLPSEHDSEEMKDRPAIVTAEPTPLTRPTVRLSDSEIAGSLAVRAAAWAPSSHGLSSCRRHTGAC